MICLVCYARQLETDVEKFKGVCESCMEEMEKLLHEEQE